MGIHKVLARTRGGFIGLHDLLTDMAQSNGATYQEAAAALFDLLNEAAQQGEKTPRWYRSSAIGVHPVAPPTQRDAHQLLARAITGGDLAAQWDAEDDIPF